ncbi:pilus assembly protein CpaF [Glaciihabitans tibetensis]|uniref:Pilus assembly protein CpaF n=1 Tax=Glaciihabitans tibetensis TaxID=1266600 RepID=A0A2T0VH04_9MICO|nr:ATPase, T2SS/T4P/T4SS family [Glaciihabitans tibetensis]PRY69494.1 pilus assembly protein CpaF [Glaciihabitans tibetensis]
MSRAISIITDRVRERVQRDGVDLSLNRHLADRYVRDEVKLYSERALGGSLPLLADEASATNEVLATLTGFGVLQPYLDDPEIEEIWINEPSRVFVARHGVAELLDLTLTEGQVRDLVERMLQSSGRRVDLSSPFVDASLPDGSRLHVVIPDITRAHFAVNIRKFSRRIRTLQHLVELDSVPHRAAEFLRMCVLSGQNILVSGATQSGKTTMLGALLSVARATDRVVTVEETFELSVPSRDAVAMQCRGESLEGTGEVSLRRLIKEALRMRPDRLVVGEVREAEALDLLIALNSGIPGMCSIHANGPREALSKLCTLPLLAGKNIDSSFVLPTVAGCVDLVVHCELGRSGKRRVVEIIAPSGQVNGATIETSSIFATRGGVLQPTGGYPTKLSKFHTHGFDPASVLAGAR